MGKVSDEKEKMIMGLYKSAPYRVGAIILVLLAVLIAPYLLARYTAEGMKYIARKISTSK